MERNFFVKKKFSYENWYFILSSLYMAYSTKNTTKANIILPSWVIALFLNEIER